MINRKLHASILWPDPESFAPVAAMQAVIGHLIWKAGAADAYVSPTQMIDRYEVDFMLRGRNEQ